MMTAQLRKNDAAKAKQFFLEKITFTTGLVELNRELERGADIVVVDVRAGEDYQKGHIPGAINLPKEQWGTCEGLSKAQCDLLLHAGLPSGSDSGGGIRQQRLFGDGDGRRF